MRLQLSEIMSQHLKHLKVYCERFKKRNFLRISFHFLLWNTWKILEGKNLMASWALVESQLHFSSAVQIMCIECFWNFKQLDRVKRIFEDVFPEFFSSF